MRPPRRQVKELFRRQIWSLREDPLKREVLRWMLTSTHPVAKKVLGKVEEEGYRLNRYFVEKLESKGDGDARGALAIGGVYYLSLIADKTRVFNGIDLEGEEGWRRIEKTVEEYIDQFLLGDTARDDQAANGKQGDGDSRS